MIKSEKCPKCLFPFTGGPPLRLHEKYYQGKACERCHGRTWIYGQYPQNRPSDRLQCPECAGRGFTDYSKKEA